MGQLERITQAQLNSVLTAQDSSLQRRLSAEESAVLGIELEKLVRRYPSQDVAESMEDYLQDFEQLALKYSVRKVQAALAALRIAPGQKFFPRPDEVADEIERQIERLEHSVRAQEGARWRRDYAAHMAKIAAERSLPEYAAWINADPEQRADALEAWAAACKRLEASRATDAA